MKVAYPQAPRPGGLTARRPPGDPRALVPGRKNSVGFSSLGQVFRPVGVSRGGLSRFGRGIVSTPLDAEVQCGPWAQMPGQPPWLVLEKCEMTRPAEAGHDAASTYHHPPNRHSALGVNIKKRTIRSSHSLRTPARENKPGTNYLHSCLRIMFRTGRIVVCDTGRRNSGLSA